MNTSVNNDFGGITSGGNSPLADPAVRASAGGNVRRANDDVAIGGLLAYLQHRDDALKVAGMNGSDGQPVIAFRGPDGQYRSGADAVNPDSVTQVRIRINGEDRYFKRIAVNDGNNPTNFSASAFAETDAAGQVKQGCDVRLCFSGYTGGMPPDPTSRNGAPVAAVLQGQMNPQSAEVKPFIDGALLIAQQQGANGAIVNYGHSNGASNAMLANAVIGRNRNSRAVLVEPLKGQQAATLLAGATANANNNIVPGVTLSADDFTRNTISVNAARTGQDGILRRSNLATTFLGNGVGEQMLANMDTSAPAGSAMTTAMADHSAANISMDLINNANGAALRNAGVTLAAAPPSQSPLAGMGFGGNNIGELIMGLLNSLMSGNGSLVGLMQGLTQGTQLAGVSQTDPNAAQGPGSGPLLQSFLGVNVGRG